MARAQRFLALTGLDPDALRAGLNNPALLAGVLDFLLHHEPDLMACAADLDIDPAALATARHHLAPSKDFS